MKKRACNSCPFRKDTPNHGAPDWLGDVMFGLMAGGLQHTCHKTDPKADGYVGHKEGKESVCLGLKGMLALSRGEKTDIETDGLFDDPRKFVLHHLKQFAPEEAREIEIKRAMRRRND